MKYNNNYGINRKLNILINNFSGRHTNLKNVEYISYLDNRISRFLTNKSDYLNNSLKKEVHNNISKKIKTNSYQGFLFKNNLPVRGQRRRSNAKTSKRFFVINKLYFLKSNKRFK